MRGAIFLLALSSCGQPTVEDHCTGSCRFYSECDPQLQPLESECITKCYERFADPQLVIAECELKAPRHAVDQFRGIPSLTDSVIDAGECARDQGCPPEMRDPFAEDPCKDVEQVCLDSFTPSDVCSRQYQIDSYECSVVHQECLAQNPPPSDCWTSADACYNQANQRYNQCDR